MSLRGTWLGSAACHAAACAMAVGLGLWHGKVAAPDPVPVALTFLPARLDARLPAALAIPRPARTPPARVVSQPAPSAASAATDARMARPVVPVMLRATAVPVHRPAARRHPIAPPRHPMRVRAVASHAAMPSAPSAASAAAAAIGVGATAMPTPASTSAIASATAAAAHAPTTPPAAAAGWANAPPTYPRAARRQGAQGPVWLRLRVGADGAVRAVALARGSGHPALDRAAMDAARSWHFRPARQDGRPVAADLTYRVVFRLTEGEQ